MIANVSAHRRANAFAQALEDQVLESAAAEQSEASAENAEQGRLMAVTGGLGSLPAPKLDPEVKTVQRAQLIAAMETLWAEGTAAGGPPQVPEQRAAKGSHRAGPMSRFRPRSRWSRGLAAGGLTVGVAAGAFSGVAAASSDALPGDSLYGLKRGMEDFKLGLADGDNDRGDLYLDQASTRLQEARRLMERGRAADLDHESLGEIRRALSGMRHDASEGHRLLHEAYERDGSIIPIQTLNSFSKSHRESWSRLRDRLPVQLTDVGDEVSSVFDAIDDEVGPLRSLLPPEPDGKPGRQDRQRTGGSEGAGASERTTAPAPSSAAPSDGKQRGGGGKPRPSSSSEKKDGGLLGGGGLLDPEPSDSPATPDKSGKGSKGGGLDNPTRPDVTIPPLLPDLLPGFGIDGGDAK
ncbi:DUF5667 domain-containing protein [Streptomyces sp. H27-D2]|uniref:DUF5667 domain-containing protein n=1 Tax=Streptomyces sp. H27-D2 TaxID=3046304 RepID=UPI002DB8E239|nr:DUF5667 domain-containing protein [Streptomyces sp. H27-D2]MEC4020285.1 DUF5667 domain-containing protein [Streptomyces sp. H27-D2]